MNKELISCFFFTFIVLNNVFSFTKVEKKKIVTNTIGLEFYIKPSGVYASKTNKFLTLDGAFHKVVKLKAERNKVDVKFILKDGIYKLKSPILIDERFFNLGFKIAFTAEHIGKVIVSGGKEISLLKKQGNIYSLNNVHKFLFTNNSLFQLFIKDERVRIASTDFSKDRRLSNVNQRLTNDSVDGYPLAIQKFRISPIDFIAISSLNKIERDQLYIMNYINWDVNIKKIDSISIKDSLIYISGKPMASWNPMNSSTRYQIFNHKIFVNKSENNCFYSNNDIYLKSSTITNSTELRATVPMIEKLLVIKGLKTQKVKNFSFNGINFEFTRCAFPISGYEASQGALTVNAAIEVNNAESIKFENCSIKHIGNYGLWFDVGCRNCKVIKCHFNDLGAGGVRIGDPLQTDDSELMTSENLVYNCIINNCGRIIPSAIGIQIGQSSYNQILHNDIFDLFYTGISVGWVWGYGNSQSHDNLIAYNNIHHVGWGRLNDMAGIYNLGVSPNNQIDHNIIHDVYTYTYGGWGIYTDEGSSNVTITNNLVYNTKSGGFHQHFGANNLLQNNIFLNGFETQLVCTRAEDHNSFTLKNNLIIWSRGELLSGPWDKINAVIDSNLYYNSLNKKISFNNKSLSDWNKMGYDLHSVIGNPELEFDGDKKITFKNTALLNKINFQQIDLSHIGVIETKDWKGNGMLSNNQRTKFDNLFLK